MPQTPWIADSHNHLSFPELRSWLSSDGEKTVHFHLQGGVDPEDWEHQEKLSKEFPGKIGMSFGLHPEWVSKVDREQAEAALDTLSNRISRATALGELGLDFRPKILHQSPYELPVAKAFQFEIFEQQLEIAQVSHKPLVLHIVQAHEESLKVLDLFAWPHRSGLVHSFNGSVKKALDFLQRDLFLSIGGPVCQPDNIRLHQAVREIPLERLLLETDSPDQAPPAALPQGSEPASGKAINTPQSLFLVAAKVAEIKSLDPREILDISSSNLRKLLRIPNGNQ